LFGFCVGGSRAVSFDLSEPLDSLTVNRADRFNLDGFSFYKLGDGVGFDRF
jgi:hypothetical protein